MHNFEITKEEINLLPLLDWEGEIIEVVTPEGAKRALSILMKEKHVGFDTETRPAFVKGESYLPALLQAATLTQAFIFRLKLYPFPTEMVEFLSTASIAKVGVGIHDDLLGLKKIQPFTPDGFVDISLLAKQRGIKSPGLRTLSAIYLQRRLSKGATRTNWERAELTEAQLKYAALDAVSGLLIYRKMLEQGQS